MGSATLKRSPQGNDERVVLTPNGERGIDSVHAVTAGELVRRNPNGDNVVINFDSQHTAASGSMPDEIVLTPGGFRPKSKVHLVQQGHALRLNDRGMQTVDHTGELLANFGEMARRAPAVPLMPGQIRRAEQALALGSGWISYANWANNAGSPVSYFATTWVVPPEPRSKAGQTIFLFNGIQNSSMIYQPVLQWGPSAAPGGGQYWAVASWYAGGQGEHSWHSTLTRVQSGNVLTGVMALTGESPNGFSYTCQFLGIPGSVLRIQDVDELTWCIQTLEAYQVEQATDYPDVDATAFRAIDLRCGSVSHSQPMLNWVAVNEVTDTGQHTVIVDPANPGGEIDVYYRT